MARCFQFDSGKMNVLSEPKPRQNGLLVLMCGIVVQACSGCATYFRTGDRGYEEIKERNAELEKQKHLMFEPGTFFGSWKM
jgi:hypothetical protein